MLTSILFAALSLLTPVAEAASWTLTTQTVALKSTIGLSHPTEKTRFTVAVCDLAVECSPSDAPWSGPVVDTATGVVWPFATMELNASADGSYLLLQLVFDPPVDANGYNTWPTTWPLNVSASRTFADGVHTVVVPISTEVANDDFQKFKAAETNNVILPLTGTKALTVDGPFLFKAWQFRLPAGSYTMQVADPADRMYTAASGGSSVLDTYCGVEISYSQPVLYVFVDENMPDLNGSSAGRGTVYCRIKQNGVNKTKAFSVNVL